MEGKTHNAGPNTAPVQSTVDHIIILIVRVGMLLILMVYEKGKMFTLTIILAKSITRLTSATYLARSITRLTSATYI